MNMNSTQFPQFTVQMEGLTPQQQAMFAQQLESFQKLVQQRIDQTRLQNQSHQDSPVRRVRQRTMPSPDESVWGVDAQIQDIERDLKKHLRMLKRELGFTPTRLAAAEESFRAEYGVEKEYWTKAREIEFEDLWDEELRLGYAELTPPPEWAPVGVHLRWSMLNEDRLRPSKPSPGTKKLAWTQEGPQQSKIKIETVQDELEYEIAHNKDDPGQRCENTPEREQRRAATAAGIRLEGRTQHDQGVSDQEFEDDGDVFSPDSDEKVCDISEHRRMQNRYGIKPKALKVCLSPQLKEDLDRVNGKKLVKKATADLKMRVAAHLFE